MPVITCFIFLIIYYGICAYALLCDGGALRIKNLYYELSFFQKVICKVAIFLSVILTFYWIKQNHFIYYWDYSGYWHNSIDRMNFVFNNTFTEVVSSLLYSINNDDYNNLLPTIIALPMNFFGYTFLWYVCINHIMFLIPAILVQALTAIKFLTQNKIKQSMVFVLALGLAVLFPANYYAMHKGYIDVAILLPLSIAIYLFIDYDFCRFKLSRDVAIALMLILAWLSRRYVIYFIIGYVVALTIKGILVLIKKKDVKIIKCMLLHFLIVGGLSLGILLIFFRKFFIKALFTDYGGMYSAYNTPFHEKISKLVSSFGYVSLIIVILVGILCCVYKKNRGNYFAFLSIIIVEIGLFWQVQEMDWHHRILINIPLFLIFMISWDFYNFDKKKVKDYFAKGTVIVCSVLLIINFYKSYIPLSSWSLQNAFFSAKYEPMQRWDIHVLEELAEYLNNLTIGTDRMIYVAASGDVLNCDILRKLHMPLSSDAIPNMYNTNDIDLRDGFPTDFLYADYVVVTDPVELHRDSGQEVVRYLAMGIKDMTSYIGCHFEKINEFELDGKVEGKVTVIIYKKISEWIDGDLEKLKMYYDNLYPGHEEIFGNRIM